MDPNAALNNIRGMINDANNNDESDVLHDLADAVRGLDEWLGRGGFLPAAWHTSQKPEPDADDMPSTEDVWLGITPKQADYIARTMVEYTQIDSEHDDSTISIYGSKSQDTDWVLVFSRAEGDTKMTHWQCTRSQYAEALATAVRKINSLPKPPEKMYLVGGCGEVFDEVAIAAAHMFDCDDCHEDGFTIKPESEAL